MSKTLWKHSQDQLPSVKLLLGKLESDVALLDLQGMEGIEQVMGTEGCYVAITGKDC
jgi:hypothetical protein